MLHVVSWLGRKKIYSSESLASQTVAAQPGDSEWDGGAATHSELLAASSLFPEDLSFVESREPDSRHLESRIGGSAEDVGTRGNSPPATVAATFWYEGFCTEAFAIQSC